MCASCRSTDGASVFVRGVTEREPAETATVLVVDDEPGVAALTSAYLKRLEMDVTVLAETDPRDALARFETERVDCVVSDYEMPGMDGLDLLAAVRERDPATPFVLVTASDDETVARRARDRGASFLRKEGDSGGFDRLAERVADAVADRED